MSGRDVLMGDSAADLNAVMNDINSAAQRFFVASDGDLRGYSEDRFANGDLGFLAATTPAVGEGDFQQEQIRIQDERENIERMRQEQAPTAMFRTMRDEIMRLQRENRLLTRQLSIAQHELRTVCKYHFQLSFDVDLILSSSLSIFKVHHERSLERLKDGGVDLANLNPSQHRSVYSYRQVQQFIAF